MYHGWFGEYLKIVEPTTMSPDQFHLAAVMTVVGAAMGRRVHTVNASNPVYPNLYAVLVGKSNESKKDTAITRALGMLKPRPGEMRVDSLPFALHRDVASAQSLIKALARTPTMLIYLSELSELLQNARRQGTRTILTTLMRAWDTPDFLENTSIQNAAVALNPFVAMIAATQPAILAKELTDTDIDSGFANRLLLVPGTGKPLRPTPPELDHAALRQHWLELKGTIECYTSRGQGARPLPRPEGGRAVGGLPARGAGRPGQPRGDDDGAAPPGPGPQAGAALRRLRQIG